MLEVNPYPAAKILYLLQLLLSAAQSFEYSSVFCGSTESEWQAVWISDETSSYLASHLDPNCLHMESIHEQQAKA